MFKVDPKLNPVTLNWCKLKITTFKLKYRNVGCVILQHKLTDGYTVIFIDQWDQYKDKYHTHPIFVEKINDIGYHVDMFGCQIYSELCND